MTKKIQIETGQKIPSKYNNNISFEIENYNLNMIIKRDVIDEDKSFRFSDELYDLSCEFTDDFSTQRSLDEYVIFNIFKIAQNSDNTKILKRLNKINNKYQVLLDELIDIINLLLEKREYKQKHILASGLVSFDELEFLYYENQLIVIDENDYKFCATIYKTYVDANIFSISFKIRYTYNTVKENKIITVKDETRINYFEGKQKCSELIKQPSNEDINKFKIRGEKIYKMLGSSKYIYCPTNIYTPSWFGLLKSYCDGRVIIDDEMFSRFNPNHYYGDTTDDGDTNNLYTLYPLVRGYSMRLKRWGLFNIDDLKEIEFNDSAFDLLELDASKKTIIRNIVSHSKQNKFRDIIGGKGNGTIFLLYGTPGVGKTLTAEAISELLKKPLYIVNIGELGTTASELEQGLNRSLELATKWDAILLIDEADIFLEKRSADNIERNAMVGIFLRLLEYYNGILFLTTNRISVIDDAFLSRISIILEYQKLNKNKRYNVWKNILHYQNIHFDNTILSELSKLEINGRQIKNIIKLAMINCEVENTKLTYVELLKMYKLTIFNYEYNY